MKEYTAIGLATGGVVFIAVFLALSQGFPKNIVIGSMYAISFFFFLRGMFYAESLKKWKEAYTNNFIALLIIMFAVIVELLS